MDALVTYGSGSDEIDNDQQQQEQKKASHEKGDISKEIPVSETSTISTMDLPPSSRVPLPLELNCEIFKCLKLPVQRKFIWGLGRDIYGMFGQKLLKLKKTKRVQNPHGNLWNGTNTRATVAADGLHISNQDGYPYVLAVQPFPTSGPKCRLDGFPGTILYYYEFRVQLHMCLVGLSESAIPDYSWVGEYPNSYAIQTDRLLFCRLAGKPHQLEWPEGADQPRLERNNVNVMGCGLVLDPEDKLWIFFTLNGNLLGRKISISPMVDHLYPAVTIWMEDSFEGNFGDDPAKPFEYDIHIHNCPGLELACI